MKNKPDKQRYENRDIAVADLKPYPNNPRDNEAAVPDVKQSIGEFDFANPIIVSPDLEIICGHTRYRAALELGLATVPCRVAHHLTERQMRKLRLVDNRTGEKSKWTDQLAIELDEIDLETGEYDFDELLAGMLPETATLEHDAAFEEGGVRERQAPSLVRAQLAIPPRLWLTSAREVAEAFNALASEYGVTIQWPD